MSMFAKIMVIVNFILAVAFLAAAGTLLGAAEDYKKKYEDYQTAANAEKANLTAQVNAEVQTSTQMKQRASDAEKKAGEYYAQLKVLQDSANATNEANKQLRADLDKLADAQKDLQGKNSDLQKTTDELRNDLAKSDAARKSAEEANRASNDQIARLTQDKETAEASLKASAEKNKADADTIDSLQTTVARYKKEKGDLSGGLSMKPVNGVVSAVDNKFDVYILSVGQKDGVEAGYEFTVYRGNEYVATVVVDKVYPNSAAAHTKPGTKKRDAQAGDEASTRL